MTMATRNLHGIGEGAAPVDMVTVHSTARLHLGFFDLAGDLGRHFGSIGLSLDAPATDVTIWRSDRDEVIGAEHGRARRYLDVMTEHLGLSGAHRLVVRDAVPAHCGLGSGTQLALCIAAAVRSLHGLELDLRSDAALLGRGGRSGIGVGLFAEGGLVVDGGKGKDAAPPPVIARIGVPSNWRIIVVLDRALEGLSGVNESAAFGGLPPMHSAVSAEICRIVLLQILPGLVEHDLKAFGAGVTRIQQVVGDHFADAQGGRFTSPAVERVMHRLGEGGAVGIGQSSWGPTGFAFVETEAHADRLVRNLRGSSQAAGLDLMICRALNQGASVTC